MTYRVVLIPSEEGFAVSCPGLPGCWSQGASEQEALRTSLCNILPRASRLLVTGR